jgi:DNA invertase Pin-like site-specific DNA recombinase
MKNRKIVAYYRVSTAKQGRSGLGLDAQRSAVEAYVSSTGSTVVREFVEIESGRKNDRPKLVEGLAFARRAKALLLVAKLDRLSRSVRFISTVLDSPVEFAACDIPEANRLVLHVLAAVAEAESKMIGERTRAAMAAAKRRGRTFGSPKNLTPRARRRGALLGAQANRCKAVESYRDLAPVVFSLHRKGSSLRQIAEHLNDQGHATANGASWSATQVHRLLSRATAVA